MLMQLKKQRGINMIEVLATIIITTVGLLGLNALQLKASRATLDSGNRSQAVWMLEDLTNRMRANLVGINEYDTNGEMSCGTAPKICSAYHSGANRVSAPSDCSVAEQAASDLHEVLCGYGAAVNDNITFSSAADFIANPRVDVSVGEDNVAEIIFSWDVRTSGIDEDGNIVYALPDGTETDETIVLRDRVTARVHP